MKVLRNISHRDYMHVLGDKVIKLKAQSVAEVPDEVADIWLKTPDITLDRDPAKEEELERLRAENEALKAAQEKSLREELIARAKELGIEGVYAPQTKIETIKKKIAEAEAKLEQPAKKENGDETVVTEESKCAEGSN